jgi:signal peptidase I
VPVLQTTLSDQLANISPMYVVVVVLALTLVRLTLAKIPEGWARTISETCDTVNFVLILAFLLIRPFVAQAFYIPSESMQNTLLVHDRLIVDKFSYRLHEPKRGDVVVFEAPPAATGGPDGIDFIKRLICLPGDTIQVTAPRITIDGQPVPDPKIHEYLHNRLGLDDADSVKIFPDHLLVNSKDTISLSQLASTLGQPGAKIVLTPGHTLRSGVVLDEPYTREDPDYDFPANGQPLRIADGELFMMGDNRNHSADSHAWGPLERRRVIGGAKFIFWPIPRFSVIR